MSDSFPPEPFSDDAFFDELAAGTATGKDTHAPDRLKDRILSALTDSLLDEERFFENLAAEVPVEAAPARLKSTIYSALMQSQTASGELLSLPECKADGRALCVFEEIVQIAPVGRTIQSVNYCRVCHARVLAERLDEAPIYWSGCPYVSFQRR